MNTTGDKYFKFSFRFLRERENDIFLTGITIDDEK